MRVFPATGGEPWVFPANDPIDTAFSPDGRFLAVSSDGRGVHVVDVATHRQVLWLSVDGPREVAWSPDGRWIAVSGYPGARVFDAARVAFSS